MTAETRRIVGDERGGRHRVGMEKGCSCPSHREASPDDGMARDAHIFDEFDNVAAGSTSYSTEMSSLEATVGP